MSKLLRLYNKNCMECKSPNIIEDDEIGELACAECGLVQNSAVPRIFGDVEQLRERMTETAKGRIVWHHLAKVKNGKRPTGTSFTYDQRTLRLWKINEFCDLVSIHLEKLYSLEPAPELKSKLVSTYAAKWQELFEDYGNVSNPKET
jgi:hypothetical protein